MLRKDRRRKPLYAPGVSSAAPTPQFLGELNERACPVCLSDDRSAVYAEASIDPKRLDEFAFASRKVPEYMHFRLINCPRCGVLYASPVPPLENLAIAYRDAAYDSSREARLAARTYAEIADTLGVTRGRALDIGAGDGAFLELLLDRGFSEVVGVEPSSAPIDSASPRIRAALHQELFDPSHFEARSFDLVTCFQTIEHVYTPRELLDGINQVLKPGGTALLIMHDAYSLSARLLGRRSPIFDVEHLQLFSERAARYLMNDRGFAEVGVRQVVNNYPIRYWTRLFPLPRPVKGALLPLLDRTRVGDVKIAIRAGNIAVWGRAPGR